MGVPIGRVVRGTSHKHVIYALADLNNVHTVWITCFPDSPCNRKQNKEIGRQRRPSRIRCHTNVYKLPLAISFRCERLLFCKKSVFDLLNESNDFVSFIVFNLFYVYYNTMLSFCWKIIFYLQGSLIFSFFS